MTRSIQSRVIAGLLTVQKKYVSQDGTEKYVLCTRDRYLIEAIHVILADRNPARVICVSSQIGCPIGCRFCLTGAGFVRNLLAGEIVEQVQRILSDQSVHPHEGSDARFEISLMSMGEPLLNWPSVRDALAVFDREFAGQADITVSTVGIVPGIYKLGECVFVCPVDLQISLHAADSELRRKLIPFSKYSLTEVVEAGSWYAEHTARKVCANYTLIDGVNDSPENCETLASLLDPQRYYVKLSRLNAAHGNFRMASEENLVRFENALQVAGFQTKRFESKGTDIGAGCGQLAFAASSGWQK